MIQVTRWKIGLVVASFLFGLWFAMPNLVSQSVRESWPSFLPKQVLNLGLDLQGGSYLLLEVDTDALHKERLNNLLEDVRTHLRDKQIVFSGLSLNADKITVRITDPSRLADAVKEINALGQPIKNNPGKNDLTVQPGADQSLVLFFDREADKAIATAAVDQSIEIVRRRIDGLGTKEPTIVRQGADRIVVQAPGESDPEQLKRVIGQTAKLTFQMVDDSVALKDLNPNLLPPGTELLPQEGRQGEPVLLVKKRALVTGEQLTSAQVGVDQYNQPAIDFRFNNLGARKFATATTTNIGKRFAIILDGKIVSAPTIQSAITGGSGQITGSFSQQSASELVNVLKAGALPAPLKVEEQRTVGAELGADAVKAGTLSAALGFVLIVLFMFLAYGFLFGGVAILALVMNVILLIALMTLGQATLTLPGIAGMILILAVAVDANVLIYERIRDEERSGHSPTAAVDIGFQRALVSILDANATSLISALIMFQFGAGPVRGFAWTLLIGVFTSVFTAALVSQLLLGIWLKAAKPKTLPI